MEMYSFQSVLVTHAEVLIEGRHWASEGDPLGGLRACPSERRSVYHAVGGVSQCVWNINTPCRMNSFQSFAL